MTTIVSMIPTVWPIIAVFGIGLCLVLYPFVVGEWTSSALQWALGKPKHSEEEEEEEEGARSIRMMKLCILLDVLGVAITIPLLPFQARDVGLSDVAWGGVGLLYGGLQVLSGPLVAALASRLGRRAALVLSMLSTAVSYFLLFVSRSATLFILSRVPVGLFRQTMMLARSMIADSALRRDHLADLTAISSVAFVIGPVGGGFLAQLVGNRWCFLLSTALLLVSALLTSMIDLHTRSVTITMTSSASSSSNGGGSRRELPGQWKRSFFPIVLTVMSTGLVAVHSGTYMMRSRDMGTSWVGLIHGVGGTVSAISSRFARRVFVMPPPLKVHQMVSGALAIVGIIAVFTQAHVWASFFAYVILFQLLSPQLMIASYSHLLEEVRSTTLLGVEDALASIMRSSATLVVSLLGSDTLSYTLSSSLGFILVSFIFSK